MIAEVESDAGIARTFDAWQAAGRPSDRVSIYVAALVAEIGRLATGVGDDAMELPLVLSGMASSTIGLRELPYAPTPFDLAGDALPTAVLPAGSEHGPITVVSGLCTVDDVMRGEETLLIGLAALGHGDGTYLLPGTHSKHVEVRGGRVVGFRTFLTGELFAILREHSVLRTCLAPVVDADDDFRQAVHDATRSNLLHEAFALRARSILHGISPEANGQRLSGLLIGSELADLSPTAPIVVAASPPLLGLYLAALEVRRVTGPVVAVPPDRMALAVALGQARLLARA